MPKIEAQGTSAERQAWLDTAFEALREVFEVSGTYKVPVNVRVAAGWPRGGRGAHAIGQCWPIQASADGHAEIFISPELGVTSDNTTTDDKAISETVFALSVLAHEMVHAIVGTEAKHGKLFRDCATAINLEGKMTATVPGERFAGWARMHIKKHGTFPMGKLSRADGLKKQSTRLVKCECAECGYIARTTAKWIAEAGPPICPADNEQMTCD